jgi:predicted DNA binding CopG/RHH family protein
LAGSKKLFEEAVKNYRELSKTKKITIRVNTEDLIKVKARAKKSNIPYQTLINALIRQFAERQASLQV